MKEKDDLIEILESRAIETMEKKRYLFSYRALLGIIHPLPDSGDWKGVSDRYAEENKQLKTQIARLTGKRQCVE